MVFILDRVVSILTFPVRSIGLTFPVRSIGLTFPVRSIFLQYVLFLARHKIFSHV